MALWTPAQISTALWLDAADATTLTLDGSSNVSAWSDKSGNARHATQTSASLRPPRVSAAQNGRDVVRFSAHNLDLAHSLNSGAAFTIFFAGRFNAFTSGQFPVPFCFATNLATGFTFFGSTAAGYQDFAFGSTANFVRLNFGEKVSSNDVTQFAVSYSGTAPTSAGSYSARHDGLASATAAAGSFAAFANASKIGANGSGNNPMLGDIFELILVDAAAGTADAELVEGYLAHKWGLADDLPIGHPYKSAAPAILSLSGTVRDASNALCARTVTAIREADQTIVGTTTSHATTGVFEIATTLNEPHTLVFSGEPGRNALVYSGVMPA